MVLIEGNWEGGGADCYFVILKVRYQDDEIAKVRGCIVHRNLKYIVEGPRNYELCKKLVSHWKLIG